MVSGRRFLADTVGVHTSKIAISPAAHGLLLLSSVPATFGRHRHVRNLNSSVTVEMANSIQITYMHPRPGLLMLVAFACSDRKCLVSPPRLPLCVSECITFLSKWVIHIELGHIYPGSTMSIQQYFVNLWNVYI